MVNNLIFIHSISIYFPFSAKGSDVHALIFFRNPNFTSHMTNTIFLKNLRFYANHGVLSQEKLVGHSFIVSVKLECDFMKAALNDKVEDTVDYGKVFQLVKREMSVRSKLMEHLALRIVTVLFNEFPTVNEVRISIMKENPPINSECDGCGVELTMTRDEFEKNS